ncbi:type II toxin-antitoxin system HicB family antitoxin [Streptococcus danieliae]|uniref:type II toxin-antitoxin system HicB family antitoxin n=1 Tax=Streptococcus danieliae TaxID=747656 RepID=UPI0021C58CEB|nr:type II toxin-antitoxin system HicB family antitoxin [Streptococcus danieliae]MCU0082180.1 type II toxin-antitoxin system HicB family antitoxin [Streptococcus danieliae]
MLLYPATFTADGDYIMVKFPDVPEAITQGKNPQEAYEMAIEVLGFVLEDYTDYPKPSTLSEVREQYPQSDIALVSIDMLSYKRKYQSKKVRKNVTVPEWLNNLAEKENLNFSQILTEALERKLEIQ